MVTRAVVGMGRSCVRACENFAGSFGPQRAVPQVSNDSVYNEAHFVQDYIRNPSATHLILSIVPLEEAQILDNAFVEGFVVAQSLLMIIDIFALSLLHHHDVS